ncbi:MAG: hypothetical protein FJ146_14665 [Deltaproteobacteria bacterium]|nr:hypothetical protein [Deltaproteobacteria bacterium]
MTLPLNQTLLHHRAWSRRLTCCMAMLLMTACASYTDETQTIRIDYRDGSYQQAIAKIDKSSLTEDKNKLLYNLEKAMILDRMGDVAKARTLLINADKIADDLYTTSISRTATSFVVSDASTDYSGEDYEKVAIHTELALSYIASGDLEAARVEARKINSKLAQINAAYEDHKDRYAEDAFARYLSGIIYEARGEVDDAIIDYNKALASYRGNFAQFVNGGVPDQLVKALYRLLAQRGRQDRMKELQRDFPRLVDAAKAELDDRDSGEVVVVHELGHIAIKTSESFAFTFGRQVVRFSFPVIRAQGRSYFGQSGIITGSDDKLHQAENVEDLNAIAHATLEDRRGRLVAKSAARLIAKGQIAEQAYQNYGPLAGLAVNIFAVVTETADTRSWTLLPESFAITRLRLKSGKHTIKIQSGGRRSKIETVTVKKGEVLILRDVG